MKKSRLSKLKLDEISLVDSPANKGARVLIAKREEEAKTFTEALAETEHREKIWRAIEGMHGIFGALQASVRSILEDDAVQDKKAAIEESVGQFQARLNQMLPSLSVLKAVLGGDPNLSIDWKDYDMDINTLTKSLEQAEATITKLQASVDTLTSENAELKKSATPADAEESSNEDVLKGLPDGVREIVEKARAEAADAKKTAEDATASLAKMADKELDRHYIAKAKEFTHLPGVKAEEFGPILKRVLHAADEADRNAVYEALAKTSQAVSELTKESGVDTAADLDGDRADTLAKEIMKRDGSSYQQAYSKALAEDPSLYKG